MIVPCPDLSCASQAALQSTTDGGEELRRVNRALRTLSAGNRTLLRAAEERELLNAMCRVIVDEGGYGIACVGFAIDDEPKTLRIAAYALRADAHPEAERTVSKMFFSWGDNELGQNVAGVVIRSGQPYIGRNLLIDPTQLPCRADAQRFGYAADCAFPLRIDGEVVGVLGISATEADAFDVNEVKLLSELAEDLAYGIGNLRARARNREAETTIRRMRDYDTFTRLPNRERLRERLRVEIELAQRHHEPLALLFLSLIHLQEINDTLGYASGDPVVQEAARRLTTLCGENELAARVGEGRFAVLLPRADAVHATQTAERLAQMFQVPVEVHGLRLDARVAIGIAVYPGHGGDPELLMRRGRLAMTEARRCGRAQMIYSQRMDEARAGQMALMADLRQAIESNALSLYCQPKAHVASGRLCGAEALVRWQHPVHGMVSPSEFITLAEYAGLIEPLTHWVMEAAFRHRRAWHEAGLDLPLAVNLSAHDLQNPGLLQRYEGLVATWGAAPDWIQFELTESAVMQDPASALATLDGLKRLGVSLAIDDFGIGHSSLSYLQRLPVDAIKIDQSFVTPILESPRTTAIIHSVLALGHDLGLEVVAEGVENRMIWDKLAELGCDVVQGYYVGRPMPPELFEAWQHSAMW